MCSSDWSFGGLISGWPHTLEMTDMNVCPYGLVPIPDLMFDMVQSYA